MRHDRSWEERVGTAVAAILAVAAFTGSTAHILEVAATYGQSGPIALVIIAGGDLLALVAGMAIRTRRRAGYTYWSTTVAVPVLGLASAGALTLAANLATADPSPWGYVLAVWPAVTFLLAVGIVETRPSDRREEKRRARGQRRQGTPGVLGVSSVAGTGGAAGDSRASSRGVTGDAANVTAGVSPGPREVSSAQVTPVTGALEGVTGRRAAEDAPRGREASDEDILAWWRHHGAPSSLREARRLNAIGEARARTLLARHAAERAAPEDTAGDTGEGVLLTLNGRR